jgi:putative endonuclease
VGEELAVEHLQKKGYKVIERNFRTRTGEIDIIARHKGRIVFIEVKTRQSKRYGNPKLALTANKQRKISMVALEYLKKNHSLQTRSRFDVVTVQPSDCGPAIEVIPNAFELAYG